MNRLSLANSPTAPWTLKEMFKALGVDEEMRAGRVSVEKDGTVKVRGPKRKTAFEGQLVSRRDLERMGRALGSAVPALARHPDVKDGERFYDLLASIRSSQFENRVNNRWFRNQDFDTELESKYRMGKRFDVPMVRLPREQGAVLRIQREHEGLDLIERFFDRGGHVAFPVYPQELKHREEASKDAIEGVRAASSDRTVHTMLPGTPEFLLKLPLNKIVHDDVIRPIDGAEAQCSIAKTEFLMDWVDKHKVRNDSFCFLPEAMAIHDKKADSSAIVRMLTPYPPPKNGEKTWVVPTYSLHAYDKDFPDEPPLLVRMIENRPDQKESPVDYAARAVLGPMVKSVMRVALDLGSSHVPHGQNLFLEIGENGQPTGRAVHTDLESFWPHPDLARPTKRAEFYGKYGYRHLKSAFEAKVWDTFRVYFLEANLPPIFDAFKTHYPDHADEMIDRVEKLVKDELAKREPLLDRQKEGPLRMFHRIHTGATKLRPMFEYFMDE